MWLGVPEVTECHGGFASGQATLSEAGGRGRRGVPGGACLAGQRRRVQTCSELATVSVDQTTATVKQ